MATPPIPVKTLDGQAELSNRQRRLSQRHRTVLLLVDGKRSERQVRTLAQQAGAGESCFGELLEMGLIAMSTTPDHLPTVPIPRPLPPAEEPPLQVDIPIDPVVPAPAPTPGPGPAAALDADAALAEGEDESLLPASGTLQPESVFNDPMPGDSGQTPLSVLEDFDAIEAADTADGADGALEEARDILLRAVRREAPLTGSLTMMRLRRARTRGELAQLIDEVETRIIKPYRSLAARQVLQRARDLLAANTNAALPAG